MVWNKKQKAKPTLIETAKEYLKAILLAVVLALSVRFFIVQPFYIPSGSMIPTFLEGDRVLVNKFSYGLRNPYNNQLWLENQKPQRWDIVVFISPREKNLDFVKRVVALPGETVFMRDGELYVDGLKMADPHANFSSQNFGGGRTFAPVKIQEGHYFMMGDNRDNSSDSRVWGTVHESLLRGKAWRLYWSWDSDAPHKNFFQRLRVSRIGKKLE
ncbi:MAG: signal peptidase I [Candidatus Adiutrix sp.]